MTFQIPVGRPTGIWKVMGSTPVGGSESSSSEQFDWRPNLYYLHFIQVTNPFIIYLFFLFRFSLLQALVRFSCFHRMSNKRTVQKIQ